MAKVTSKLQITLPKAIAEHYGIRPGDDLDFVPAGDVIRVVPEGKRRVSEDRKLKIQLFDEATERNSKPARGPKETEARDRGWTRGDLYSRGRSR